METKTDGHFRTLSGIKFSLIEPKPEMIHIDDIVAGLANKGHFSGQTKEYFSIAEHCLLTQYLCSLDHPHDTELRLIALLHDASEAYIGDIIKPLKDLVPEFKEIENKIHRVIFDVFNLPFDRMAEIKNYDLLSQDIEFLNFYGNPNCLEQQIVYYHKPNKAGVLFRQKVKMLLDHRGQK